MNETSQEALVYVDDADPGIRRERRGAGFVYRDPQGRVIRDPEALDRIRKLAIPPAYTAVWICPLANGHLQATGRDARGRKQYRYHARWSALRGAQKFERLVAFGRALGRIRAQVARDLASAGSGQPGRTLVLATVVRLLDATLMRVGTDRYAKDNRSYGLTTLRDRHAEIRRGVLELSFRGKSGVRHQVLLEDPRLARVVRRCQELPGQELFQFQDEDGEIRSVGSGDVNDYISDAAGERFTAKDFRTWHGTVLALEWTRRACLGISEDPSEADRAGQALTAAKGARPTKREADAAAAAPSGYSITAMLADVSRQLGNTPAVCRKAYVHPAVLELGSTLTRSNEAGADAALWKRLGGANPPASGMRADERRLLRFLEDYPVESEKALIVDLEATASKRPSSSPSGKPRSSR